jgi:hypothetical protein
MSWKFSCKDPDRSATNSKRLCILRHAAAPLMKWFGKIMKALTRGMGDLSPGCRQAVGLQSAALDGKLSFRERLGLRIHLALCQWCRRYGKQIRFLQTAARKHAGEEQVLPQRTLSPEARERIKQRLQSEKK